MTTTVVHINDPAGFDIYIGRMSRRAKNPAAHIDSPWRNPEPVPIGGGPTELAANLARFERYLESQDIEAVWIRANLDLIRGKRLACWCAKIGVPLTAKDRHVCHGQVLAELADRQEAVSAELAVSIPGRVIPSHPMTLSGPLMTADEHRLMDSLSVVSGQFRDLLRPGDHHQNAADWAEVARTLHDLQARVMARAAARAYPGRYRLPGGQ